MVKINPEIKKIIEENPLALATVDNIGKPNVIAVACVKIVSKNQILITDNCMSHTKENLRGNSDVCLAVWNKQWKGYKLIGNAEYFTSGKWKKAVDEMPENKGMSAKGAILITISKLVKLK